MKNFHCDVCGNLLFFESVQCVRCGHSLAFVPDRLDLNAWESSADGTVRLVPESGDTRTFRRCANAEQPAACNWLVRADEPEKFCVSCRLNEVIPDLNVPGNPRRWHRIEQAKRRLVYSLLKLRLPTETLPDGERTALRFKFMGDTPGKPPVMTGHDEGVVTLNIAEADDDVREQRRISLNEPMRTLMGHLRHEVSHYYWDRLVKDSAWLARFRELFGDERADYQEALNRHYREGAPADWNERGVSAYATMHPWEDWAETMAHYFHLTDAVETAGSFGIRFRPEHPSSDTMVIDAREAADRQTDFDALLHTWIGLTFALNCLNRGMGLPDIYPFALSVAAINKLRFVHEVVLAAQNDPATTEEPAEHQSLTTGR